MTNEPRRALLGGLAGGVRHTFRSLRVRNYRLYFIGQLVSLTGTWMQAVAQDWLVLRLTGRPLPVGITTSLQFLPVLLFGLWGGALADRLDKRRIVLVTQSAMGMLALVLGLLTLAGVVELWMIYGLALLLGCVTAVDNPTRQAFVTEMVGPEHTANAVALNGAVFNTARVLGPAVAALTINVVGLAPAFLLNAVSFGAVLAALFAMDPAGLQKTPPRPGRFQVAAGLRHVWETPRLRSTLLALCLVATLGMNFRVVIPLLARFTFHADIGTYGLLASLFAVGSVGGALATAARSAPGRRFLAASAGAFGMLSLLAALAPSVLWAGPLLALAGAAAMAFMATANSTLQVYSDPSLRGRVMSVYILIFLGSTPVGALLVGWLSERFGPRSGLLLAAASGFAAALAAAPRRRDGDGPEGSPFSWEERRRPGTIACGRAEPAEGE